MLVDQLTKSPTMNEARSADQPSDDAILVVTVRLDLCSFNAVVIVKLIRVAMRVYVTTQH